jgi:predicted 3-demethylubiquinone-9 3-methyltransferase (glyoxalase superfamily)
MQGITPCLWFDTQAEEAVNYYVQVIEDSGIDGITHYGPNQVGPEGQVWTVAFHLKDQPFLAFNGGPVFKFTPAISFILNCDTQEQIDHLWEALSDGGVKMECGWVTDRFGVSWQIVPAALGAWMLDEDPERFGRVMAALLTMTKLDLATLEAAYNQS